MTADPDTPHLQLIRDGGTATILFENSARHNAFTAAMWEALPHLVAEAVADDAVRVIVLRGAGERAFSAGADISEFETQRSGNAAQRYDQLNHDAFAALLDCPKPTIAMIHGNCLGGGLALALCCDLRIADEVSLYSIPAAKLGIGYNPRWMPPLMAAVPPAAAKEIMFTGRRIPAAEAKAMGLVNRIVPREALAAEVAKLVADISANAPLTIRAAKATIDALAARSPSADTMTKLDAMVSACMTSDDYAEGRRAFLEKRTPRFAGR